MSDTQSGDSGPRPWWQINAQTWGTTFRWVRLPVTAIAAIGLILFFASATTGGAGFVIGVTLWWFGPFVVYLSFITSRRGSILFGVLLLLVTALEIMWILDEMETSSTGAIGFLTLPLFTYPGVVLAGSLDQKLRRTELDA